MLKECKVIMPNTIIYYSTILPRINENYVWGINRINVEIIRFCEDIDIKIVHHDVFREQNDMNHF